MGDFKNKILLKRSDVAGHTPSVSSLSAGEIVVNTADGIIFLKKIINSNEYIVKFLNSEDYPYLYSKSLSSIKTQYGGNVITQAYDIILGGANNRIDGSGSSILNGETNIVESDLSTILGGYNNQLSATADYSVILGGYNNLGKHFGTYILGNDITTHSDFFAYVNNLSSTQDIWTGGRFLSGGKELLELLKPSFDLAIEVYTAVKNTSADWNSVYSYVRSTSSLDLDSRTFVNINSANTIQVNTKVNTTSANWDSNYSHYNTTSSTYAPYDFVNSKFLPNSGGTVTGDTQFNNKVTIYGVLSAMGGTYFANTVYSTTSALCVMNFGNSGPALYVSNDGIGDIASFYDYDQNIEVLHVAGSNGSYPGVGIKTSTPNVDFTVNGVISASNDIYTNGRFLSSGQELLSIISPNINIGIETHTNIKTLTGDWNSVYSYTNNISSRELEVRTFVGNNSANIINVNTKVFSTSSNWDSNYSHYNTTSSTYAPYNFVNSKFLPTSGGNLTGKLNLSNPTVSEAGLNIGVTTSTPSTLSIGDLWGTSAGLFYRSTSTITRSVAVQNGINDFSRGQIIDVSEATSPALRITQRAAGLALRIEDDTTPDSTPFVVDNMGSVGIGLSSLSGIDAKLTVIGNVSATGSYYGDGSKLTGIVAGDTIATNLVRSNSANWAFAYNVASAYVTVSSTFLTSETDSQTLSFNEGTKELSISNGNFVSLSALVDTSSSGVDMEVRALTGKWDSSYTTVQNNSASWESTPINVILNSDPLKFVFIGDGSTTSYTVSGTAGSTNASLIEVFVDNVRQEPVISYTLSSEIVEFTDAPVLSSRIVVVTPNNYFLQIDEVLTLVQNNSATNWNYQGTDLKALTGNWENTFTNVQSNSASWTNSKTIAFFTALNNEPPATNFATLDTRNSHPVLDFDATTQESTIFRGIIPEGVSLLSGCNVITQWTATSATSGTIGWDVAFERIASNGINLNADNFGTPQTITAITVPSTAGVTLTSSCSFIQTQLPSGLTNGDMYRLRIRRDVANDTASGDAELLGVEVRSVL